MARNISDERLRSMIRKIVLEEMANASKKEITISKITSPSTTEQFTKKYADTSKGDKGPWAIFGSPKPDPAKAFKRLERPRALAGWSEPYQDTNSPGPYRPKKIKKA